jgi:hypothetical protein
MEEKQSVLLDTQVSLIVVDRGRKNSLTADIWTAVRKPAFICHDREFIMKILGVRSTSFIHVFVYASVLQIYQSDKHASMFTDRQCPDFDVVILVLLSKLNPTTSFVIRERQRSQGS